MKVTVTGSLGNISKPLTEKLVKAGHQISVISSKADKVSEIEALGATALIGSVDDVDFLTKAFTGADAIYTMVPPNFAATNYRGYIGQIGGKYAQAIKQANVKRVVNLSSIGAHLDGGTGPIAGIHDVEGLLNKLEGVAVKHLRAGFFYINFLNNIDMIKHLGFQGSNYAGNARLLMVHPNDIATAAAEEIQQAFTGKSIRYVISDDRTLDETTTILGAAIGKPDLKWVEFTDDQALQGMLQAGLPTEISNMYVEMGTAVRSGALRGDYDITEPSKLGDTKLEDFAKEFAAKY